MIDLHTHILPTIDDGATGLDATLEMLELAAADGIRTIVGTPHYDLDNPADSGRPQLMAERLVVTREAARRRAIPVEVCGGFELMLTPALAELGAAARAFGLNGSLYLLVESPVSIWPPFALDVLRQLRANGLRPILAHAERYAAIALREDLAEELVRAGVLLQVNGDSLLGIAGHQARQRARGLLRRGVVSFLASDAHGPQSRPPGLRAAACAAAREIGEAAAQALVMNNPAAVLADADLPSQTPFERRGFFRRWWRSGR